MKLEFELDDAALTFIADRLADKMTLHLESGGVAEPAAAEAEDDMFGESEPKKTALTVTECQDAARAYIGAGKDKDARKKKVIAVLTKFGVERVAELPAEKMEKFVADIQKLK